MSRFFIIIFILTASCTTKKNLQISRTELKEWLCDYGDHSKSVIVPHTPLVEPLVVNDQWQGRLNYLKTIQIDDPENGKTWLHFEGVMNDTKVFVNQQLVTRHLGGYLPLSVDITRFISKGENKIRLEVRNTDNPIIPPGKSLETLDFNYYGGIYRDAWLIRKNHIYITDPFIENTKDAGWLLHFDTVSASMAYGELRIQLRNDLDENTSIGVETNLTFGEDSYIFNKKLDLKPSSSSSISIPIEIPNPKLWSVTSPNLYDLSINIIEEGQILDRIEDKTGIRHINFNKNGFFLNGQKMFIRGTNRHQEYPYLGYAISDNANYRDALKIKNAGFDFVRLSHYPQDESFLNACDELGLLVMNAIPGWQFYQEGEFIENSYQDIRDMVRRDRNHPSVVFWEVSLNESAMTDQYIKEANAILKKELPYEETYSAGWMDHPAYDLFIPARQHSGPPHYWNYHKDGKRNIFIAEYGDWEYYAHNAGFNQTAFDNLSEEARNSRQLRKHGERRLLQQALNFQEAANSNRNGVATIGHANWLMFDYNRGYADDLEASGISDIFRIPKFAYYFYKSQRPPNQDINHPLVEDGPMIKIASYWTENSPTDVTVFSNCDLVELYLNDSLIDRISPTLNHLSDNLISPPFHFQINSFQPGQLIAKGYVNEVLTVTDTVNTPGEPKAIELSVDYQSDYFDENDDVIFIYAKIVDIKGTIIPEDSSEVMFKLNSQGNLIGDNPVRAEAGIATILFRGDPSTLDIEANGDGLLKANHTH